MKIVFVSNYYNYHQESLSKALAEINGVEYKFIETSEMDADRIKMGWAHNLPEYVVSFENYKNNIGEISSLIQLADVVIFGSAPNFLIRERIKTKKLTFIYSERLYKKAVKYLGLPMRTAKYLYNGYNKKNVCLLAASAYAYSDYKKSFCFRNRAYRFGYFPQEKKYQDVEKILEWKHHASILWVARLIELKHPELPIKVAKKLKEDGYQFTMNLIGGGKLENKLRKMIAKFKLEDNVHMLGSMKPEDVRVYMEKSQIFMFTSDRNEGWGAVLNESMNSACAVVANKQIGSVPFVVKDGENGYIYTKNSVKEAYAKVKYLLDNPKEASRLGKRAYETIVEEWNAQTATKNLLKLINNLLNNTPLEITQGPCSFIE